MSAGNEVYVPVTLVPPARPGIHAPPEADPKPPPHRRRPPVVRDLEELAPAFRERLELVLERLRAKGHQPRVWETYRTPDRGRWLRKSGRSRNGHRSMHVFRAAADIICARHKWDCHKHGCSFFEDLGAAVAAEGLYWGGNWRTIVDKPHVQAVPVGRKQGLVRAGVEVATLMRPRPTLVGHNRT